MEPQTLIDMQKIRELLVNGNTYERVLRIMKQIDERRSINKTPLKDLIDERRNQIKK